jgi:hypothetical protein
MSLVTLMNVRIGHDHTDCTIAQPNKCSLASHVWSLPGEKPRLAANLGRITFEWLEKLSLVRGESSVRTYLGKNFEAIDLSLAPIDLGKNLIKLAEKVKSGSGLKNMVSDFAKTLSAFRDTLKGVALFHGRPCSDLISRTTLLKNGVDIVNASIEMKGVYDSIPNKDFRTYGQDIAKTWKGLEKASKIFKHLASFTAGVLGLTSVIRGTKANPVIGLAVGTAAISAAVAEHFFSRQVEAEEARNVHANFELKYKQA